MAGTSANRRLIKNQYKDEHGLRDEKRLNFARSRTVPGLGHVGGMIITPGHLHTVQKTCAGKSGNVTRKMKPAKYQQLFVLEMLFRPKHRHVILLHHLYRCGFVLFIELIQQHEGNQGMLYKQHILGVITGISWHMERKHGGKGGSIFSYRGGSDRAAQRKRQLMAILRGPEHCWLARHVHELKFGTVQEGDNRKMMEGLEEWN